MSEPDTVEEVAEGAATDETNRSRLPMGGPCLARIEQEQDGQYCERRHGQDWDETRQHPERGAAVLRVFQRHPAINHLDSRRQSARADRGDDQNLRQLVDYDDSSRDSD